MACPLDFYCHGSAQQMNGRGRRNDAGSSLADSVQRVRQNQMTDTEFIGNEENNVKDS